MTTWTLGVRRPDGVTTLTADHPAVTVGGTGLASGDGDFWIEVTADAEGLDLDHLVIDVPATVRPGDLAWLNGYQSWSESDVRPLTARRPPLNRAARLLHLDRMGDEAVAADRRDRWAERSHEVLATQVHGTARLWGSRVGADAFTVLEVTEGRVRAVVDVAGWRLAPGERTRVAWLEARTGESAPRLLRDWAGRCATALPAPAVTGWTSWYRYYRDVDARRLAGELDGLARAGVRCDVFQIDDGYQTRVGDWGRFADGFPAGVAPLAAAVRAQGMLPGLWLAPFVAAGRSELVREHPDWVLRDARGRRVPAGWNPLWQGTFWALDLADRAVLDHLAEAVRRARDDWGFGLFKMDFLYAAALDDRPGATRAQRMRRAMGLLREWCGEAPVLGCGVPLVSAAGLVEYCRVGPDVAATWEDGLQRRLRYPERVSTVSSVRSTLARAWTDGAWFGLDPDVVVLRDAGTRLTEDERRALFAVNTTLGSLVFTSDDVAGLDEAATEVLRGWDPPGAARVRAHTRQGDQHRVVTEEGVLVVDLGDRGGRVVAGR